MVSPVRLIRWLGPASFLAGILILALAVARGEGSLYLVLIVPVVVATGPLALLGIVLVFAGFLLTFWFWPSRSAGEPHGLASLPVSREGRPQAAPPTRRWGGVLFLGPIPVIFGSDPRLTRTMLVVGVILFFALLALTIFALFA